MCHDLDLGDGAMKRAWAGWLVMGLLEPLGRWVATRRCEKSKKPGGGAAGGVAEEIAATGSIVGHVRACDCRAGEI